MLFIDPDAVITVQSYIYGEIVEEQMTVAKFIKRYTKTGEVPTIDPVRHGHWQITRDINGISYWECSSCNSEGIVGWPYCSWCGAKMDEEIVNDQ